MYADEQIPTYGYADPVYLFEAILDYVFQAEEFSDPRSDFHLYNPDCSHGVPHGCVAAEPILRAIQSNILA